MAKKKSTKSNAQKELKALQKEVSQAQLRRSEDLKKLTELVRGGMSTYPEMRKEALALIAEL